MRRLVIFLAIFVLFTCTVQAVPSYHYPLAPPINAPPDDAPNNVTQLVENSSVKLNSTDCLGSNPCSKNVNNPSNNQTIILPPGPSIPDAALPSPTHDPTNGADNPIVNNNYMPKCEENQTDGKSQVIFLSPSSLPLAFYTSFVVNLLVISLLTVVLLKKPKVQEKKAAQQQQPVQTRVQHNTLYEQRMNYLSRYIDYNLRNGVNFIALRQFLNRNGYTDQQINYAYSLMRK